jgi:hypothetical protein
MDPAIVLRVATAIVQEVGVGLIRRSAPERGYNNGGKNAVDLHARNISHATKSMIYPHDVKRS